ncbi:hypothetical protein LAZ67_16001593 [Cordylochernes scorpioides]|uniref:Ig-like domain-containing protein n=1 Tax=Cordylochernes scorpioides TaxID=51811 RepID=A0ABY6LFK0_9ARAC|nr:hypothetical protein LAZ67_16001593 [Cordylochernes scorpioides]
MPGYRKRRQFKQTDAFTRGMVIGLKRAGWSIRQIAADTHLGASTMHRLWRRWLEQGNVAIYRNVGATRVTSARVDRHHSISTRTISRRLVANGLHSCRPLRRLPLTPPKRRQRLEWCRARSTWMTEWHRVVFSDESRFCLSSDSRRVRVWRRRGERSNPAAIVERPTVRQRGIMVWGAIAYDSRSPLLRIQGTMTAQRYVDDVLRPVTLPYLQGVPNALYQQDNARPHTARISQQALQDVQMLPWPPYSPDLSPIEHVWDIIGRRLYALPQPRSEDELWQMVEREWRAIPQDAIRTLIGSLPRRVAACIAALHNNRDLREQWKRAEQLTNEFWIKWTRDYIPNLMSRSKWHHQTEPIRTEYLVFIVDKLHPRNMWERGFISDVHFEPDGQVRVATITTKQNGKAVVKAVSWVRQRDIHILTVGKYTYTSDLRFTSIHLDSSDVWTLEIKYATDNDSGVYECQVSTEPKMSLSILLNVVVAKASIPEGSNLYIQSGSTINLTCVITESTSPPVYVFWSHEGRVINYDASRGGIKVTTEKGPTTVSRLQISGARAQDSGRYSCIPSYADAANITVHVLNAMAAALQKIGIDPEQQLYTPKIVDIAAAVIEMHGDI